MRRAPRALTLIALVGATSIAPLALVAADASTPRSFATSSPSQIVGAAQAATSAAGTFLATCSTQVASAGLTGTTATRIARTYGAQTQSTTVKGLGTGHMVTTFTGGVAYFKGDALALEIQFNAKNAKWANKWISVKKGQQDYASITSGMTTASAISQFTPVGSLRKSAIRIFDGVAVVAITGAVPASWQAGTGTAVLYVSTGSPHYPVAVTIATKLSGQALSGKCTFTSWKKGFSVAKPASSTPINLTGL